jgi:hypothetical protein
MEKRTTQSVDDGQPTYRSVDRLIPGEVGVFAETVVRLAEG